MKKLVNVDEALDRYFERIEPLRSKTACVLWQLPPNLQIDLPRLERFLCLLPRGYQYAVEFRHPSWMENRVFDLLWSRCVAFTSVSSLVMPISFNSTADVVYIRFHGLEGGAAHDYTRRELQPWAEHARKSAVEGKRVLVYFNNDLNVCAPANAKVFMQMTGAVLPSVRGDPGYLMAA
jgi:uncharacterized protein YecE (DUF72 family)